MKRFVAIYLGSATALAQWKATDDQKRKEQEKAGMDAWMKWVKENEASIVDLGSPLGVLILHSRHRQTFHDLD